MKGIVSMRNLGCSLLLWFGVMTPLAAFIAFIAFIAFMGAICG